MVTVRVSPVALAIVLAVAAPGAARAEDDDQNELDAELTGFEEVPALSTPGTGEFRARIVEDAAGTRIEYELSYRGLVAPAAVAHIHLGQRGVSGGVSAFLCGGGDKPACPAEGTVTGTIDAEDVVGPDAQGIAPGELDELVRAIRAGATYANVHSATYPQGEIRGQIDGDDTDDDDGSSATTGHHRRSSAR
jgi:hypothetical protein